MSGAPGLLRIRQVHSTIGCGQGQRRTVRSLGLKHVGDEVVRADRPEVRGMIAAVAHLVTVSEEDGR